MKTEENIPKHLNQILGAAYGNKSAIWDGTLRASGTERSCSSSREKPDSQGQNTHRGRKGTCFIPATAYPPRTVTNF